MTADFFGATLATSSYDLQEKSDHGKEEQVEEASSGKGQTPRRQEERRQKESPASEDQGEGEDQRQGQEIRQTGQGSEKGRQGCPQEGKGQDGGKEGRAQAGRPAKSRRAVDPCTDSGAPGAAGRRNAGIADASQHGTLGVLIAPKARLGARQPLQRTRAATVREYSGGQGLRADFHVLVEHALEDAA